MLCKTTPTMLFAFTRSSVFFYFKIIITESINAFLVKWGFVIIPFLSLLLFKTKDYFKKLPHLAVRALFVSPFSPNSASQIVFF